jgi:hypothetical protein
VYKPHSRSVNDRSDWSILFLPPRQLVDLFAPYCNTRYRFHILHAKIKHGSVTPFPQPILQGLFLYFTEEGITYMYIPMHTCWCTGTHTQTLSLSLSLTHTHTHTHLLYSNSYDWIPPIIKVKVFYLEINMYIYKLVWGRRFTSFSSWSVVNLLPHTSFFKDSEQKIVTCGQVKIVS